MCIQLCYAATHRIGLHSNNLDYRCESKIRGDPFILPIPIAGGLGTFRAVDLFGGSYGLSLRRRPAGFGLGERALGCRR